MKDELILPQCPEIEAQIVGNAMQEQHTIPKLKSEGIESKHFLDPVKAKLWGFLVARHEEGLENNLPLVINGLKDAGMLDGLGGPKAIFDATDVVPIYTDSHLAICAQKLRDKYTLRLLVVEGMDLVQECYRTGDADDAVYRFQRLVEKCRKELTGRQNSRHVKALVEDFLGEWTDRAKGQVTAKHETGLYELDHALGGGIPRGGLTVCAGTTGAGKTALALHMALNACNRGDRVLFVSLEMSDFEIIERLVSNSGNVSMSDITNPQEPTKSTLAGIERAINELKDSDAWFCDTSVTAIEDILSEAEMRASQKPLNLVIVDYIQLVEGTRQKGESREREVADISRRLHMLGMKTGAAVVGMSQLNDDGRMRESRAIAQDAKCILEVTDEAGIQIVKNRQGPKPSNPVPLYLKGEFQRFVMQRC